VNHYPRNYTHQFFTLTDEETSSYRKKGTRYTKTWEADKASPLLLLNILDFATRNWVSHAIKNGKKYLNTAFPVIKNKVYRFSNNKTVGHDRAILNIICGLTMPDGRAIDGYYMERQENVPLHSNTQRSFNNAISTFHSEIGLCRHAFHKIRLTNIKTTSEAPSGPAKGRKTNTRRNNRSRSPNRTLTLSRLRSKSPNRPASAFMFDSPPRAASASASMFDSPNRAASASALSLNNSPPRTKRGLF
jgi:hypothetical protein